MGCAQAKKSVKKLPPARTLSTARTNLEPALIQTHRELSGVDHNLCMMRRASVTSRHNDIDNEQMEHQLLSDLTRGEIQMDAHESPVYDNPDGLRRQFSPSTQRRSNGSSHEADAAENRETLGAPDDLLHNLSDDQQKRCTEVAETVAQYSMQSPTNDNPPSGEFPEAGKSSTSIENEARSSGKDGDKEMKNAVDGNVNASGDSVASVA